MKRRLKRWVKVVFAIIIITIVAITGLVVCSKVDSSNTEEPEIEYGDILQVEIKETK